MAFVALGLPSVVGLAYYVGFCDRPKFEEHDSLLKNGNQLFCIVATSTEQAIGSNEARLLAATQRGIESLPKGKDLMKQAALIYGAVQGSERLGISLYFDDPKKEDAPRWAVGWAVHTPGSFRDIQNLVDDIKKGSGLTNNETIRAVRLGRDRCLRATVPWRMKWTPELGARLHWKRAYKAYHEAGLSATCGRDGIEGSVAVEFFKTGPDDSMQFIDYVVMFGNTQILWDDAFPLDDPLLKCGDSTTSETSVDESRKADAVTVVSDVGEDQPGIVDDSSATEDSAQTES